MSTTTPGNRVNSQASSAWPGALDQGIQLLSELLQRSLAPDTAEKAGTLLGLCHLLLFRLQTGSSLPLIGIVGNADSGKSTLFNSVAGSEVSLVTPIPHQTLGPILATPTGFEEPAGHPSLFRPVASRVEWSPPGSTGLTGSPESAFCVPAWKNEARPFVLMDLPDVGTVDSREEHQVALRLLPWLDRVILLVTEESFAQADHEDINRALRFLRPERARAELFVVLNRRHGTTEDAAFGSRLAKVRELWPQATVSRLPHLEPGARFSVSDTEPLVGEASARGSFTLRNTLRNLAAEVTTEVSELSNARQREQRVLRERVQQEIRSAGRFSRAFLSEEFRRRLEAFSPWRTSVRRVRALLGKGAGEESGVVNLMAEAPVQRHLLAAAQRMREDLRKQLQRIADEERAKELPVPDLDEEEIRRAVSALVSETNQKARRNAETLLESLQERHKFKDPGWGILTVISSSVLMLDLFIPGMGTIGSVAVAALLSALGVGGILTSDFMRKLRAGQVRESFEAGMRLILEQAASKAFASRSAAAVLDFSEVAGRLASWTHSLPEV
jgi:hypothetical protein